MFLDLFVVHFLVEVEGFGSRHPNNDLIDQLETPKEQSHPGRSSRDPIGGIETNGLCSCGGQEAQAGLRGQTVLIVSLNFFAFNPWCSVPPKGFV